MPITITYLEDNGVFLRGHGRISFDDVLELNSIRYASPAMIKNLRYQLCDLSDVTEIALNSQEVAKVAWLDVEAAKHNPEMLMAVVGEQDLVFGLIRMWELYAESIHVKSGSFRTVEDARKWLNESQTLESD